MDISKLGRWYRHISAMEVLLPCLSATLLPCLSAMIMQSCTDGSADRVVVQTDSLNQLAYYTRYLNIDTTANYAEQALNMSAEYDEGRAEALSNLGFVQYMLMDYDSAAALYTRSYDLSKSILTKAVADVGLMKICQVTGQNEKFYEYRSDAERKLHRIDSDPLSLTPAQLRLLNYAKSEFHMASSAYYNYIMQDSLAQTELDAIASDMDIVNNDSAQLARYYTLTGQLDKAMDVARRARLVYMQASVMQKLAQGMINNIDEQHTDSIFPFSLGMAQTALWLFRGYGSIYSRALTYLTISDYYLHAGHPEVALDTATKALEFVNIQHQHVYGQDATFLMPFDSAPETISTEMSWMKQGYRNCAWEWIATIREHLSIVYSSMGMKRQSDYNRNIYLDILDATRQDRHLEHQVYTLEQERKGQNMLIILVALLSLLIAGGLYLAIKRMKRNAERKSNNDIKQVDTSFRRWMSENEELYSSMEEEQQKLESETYLHEQHIAENKRSYIDKCTSLSLVYSITPFLDRAINELNKLKENTTESQEVKVERLDYLRGLIDRICLYNEVLSHWIKVRQGMVNLNIENFEIQPLLNTLAKNQKSFINKGLSLTLNPTDAVVKADKALTMFMINTLLDNARKYTPQGGAVSVDTAVTDTYVEISVTDTGRGLSPEDINTICNDKVYDSSRIGEPDTDEELRKQKGFGFGLMNCKGIIDKYKKTNAIFSVCLFSIESQLGQGSRFFFRLPRGVMRTSAMILIFLFTSIAYGSTATDAHIERAAQLADSVYFANVDGMYEKAMIYADSVIAMLNKHYASLYPGGNLFLTLHPTAQYPDIQWWHTGVDTDYDIILDVRNETAIAALALKQWEVYRYNNEIYFRLYKLITQDTSLETLSTSIRKANTTRQSLIVVAILLIVIATITFLVVYYRIHLLPTFNLRQLMQFNQRLFSGNVDNLTRLAFDGVNDIKSIECLTLSILQDEGQISTTESAHSTNYDPAPIIESMQAYIAQTLNTGTELTAPDGHIHTYPLHAQLHQTEERMPTLVGVMAISLTDDSLSQSDAQIIRLMAGHIATYIYYTRTQVDCQRNSIEQMHDERLRAEREEQAIHTENMVLDNCLSAIKHETMYYPSRIRQILIDTGPAPDVEQISTLGELLSYYKEVFTLLSSCAARQLTSVHFKRKPIATHLLADYAAKTMKRNTRRLHLDSISLDVETSDDATHITGDQQMLQYLIDNLILSALHNTTPRQLSLKFDNTDDGMSRIRFVDPCTELSSDQLQALFYPESLHYDEQTDTLIGVEYLVCRQIIRQHDEYGGHRGSRINAYKKEEGMEIEIKIT